MLETWYCCSDFSGFEVTIFEKDATCGGHTLTDDSAEVPVDLGFQVRDSATSTLPDRMK